MKSWACVCTDPVTWAYGLVVDGLVQDETARVIRHRDGVWAWYSAAQPYARHGVAASRELAMKAALRDEGKRFDVVRVCTRSPARRPRSKRKGQR